MALVEIDGSFGEGGGQIIRSALALSTITQKPFKITKIRANRSKPGLQNQHLTCVKAAAQICGGKVEGAETGSTKLSFYPGSVQGGTYKFAIGTAGSTMLVLQTIFLPLVLADRPSEIQLEGGTHNTHAPPFEFIKDTFMPVLAQMGAHSEMELRRYGFYPPGGGKVEARIAPAASLTPLHLGTRQSARASARALVVKLAESIGDREMGVIKEMLPAVATTRVEHSDNAVSPGNVVFVSIDCGTMTETVSSIGERGLRAEKVAQSAAIEAKRFLESDVCVGQHLADQLVLPLALAGTGSYLTLEPTLHTSTNIAVIQKFLDVQIEVEQVSGSQWRVKVRN